MRWFLWGRSLAIAAALASASCVQASTPAPRPAFRSPIDFQYYTATGDAVGSASLRGRVTAVIFVTTYDAASQLEVLDLQGLVRRYAPRINALVVVVEAPQYASLLPVYSESLGLTIPVSIADYATLSGEGPFGSLLRVPTLVLLDKEGIERWRAQGSVSGGEMERQVRLLTGIRR